MSTIGIKTFTLAISIFSAHCYCWNHYNPPPLIDYLITMTTVPAQPALFLPLNRRSICFGTAPTPFSFQPPAEPWIPSFFCPVFHCNRLSSSNQCRPPTYTSQVPGLLVVTEKGSTRSPGPEPTVQSVGFSRSQLVMSGFLSGKQWQAQLSVESWYKYRVLAK